MFAVLLIGILAGTRSGPIGPPLKADQVVVEIDEIRELVPDGTPIEIRP